MQAVILNAQNQIIGALTTIDRTTRSIIIAGDIAQDSSPVNRKEYKISRSKANLARASQDWGLTFASQHQHNGLTFFTL